MWLTPLLFLIMGATHPTQSLVIELSYLIGFTSVLLHELGHCLTARHLHVHTDKITLTPIGGVATIQDTERNPKTSLLIALGGPAVSLAIILTCLVLPHSFPNPKDDINSVISSLPKFIGFAAILNIGILLFNLLPFYPSDGGRVLKCSIALLCNKRAALLTTATVNFLIILPSLYLFFSYHFVPGLFIVGISTIGLLKTRGDCLKLKRESLAKTPEALALLSLSENDLLAEPIGTTLDYILGHGQPFEIPNDYEPTEPPPKTLRDHISKGFTLYTGYAFFQKKGETPIAIPALWSKTEDGNVFDPKHRPSKPTSYFGVKAHTIPPKHQVS
jgi:Zn-dependent protease